MKHEQGASSAESRLPLPPALLRHVGFQQANKGADVVTQEVNHVRVKVRQPINGHISVHVNAEAGLPHPYPPLHLRERRCERGQESN